MVVTFTCYPTPDCIRSLSKTIIFVHPDFYLQNEGENEGKNEGKNEDEILALTEREALVISVLSDNPKLSTVKLGSMLNIKKSTMDRTLKSLKEKGWLSREGSTNGGRWIIHKPDKTTR